MALSWRTSVLADRHRALGSKLEDWNGMGTAWTYSKDVAQDHVAIRTKAALMDVSGLKKLYLVGPHASAILNYTTTRDVTKIYPGKSAYACMLNEAGHFIEDCILYRTGPNSWMVVHGSGAGHETLTKYVVGRNASMIVDDDLHDLSLQGPIAVEARRNAGTGTGPEQHPSGRPGVHAIERARGARRAAGMHHRVVAPMLDPNAEHAQRVARRLDVASRIQI